MFDILLPKTKPFTVGIFYRPPNQNNFVDNISIDFNKLLPEEKEIYFLGDFNINILFNGKSILDNTKNIDIDSPAASFIAKQYNELCSLFSLKQLIKEPTRITSSSSTLIDHILTNSTQKISQSGVIDTTLSDHQMVYCTRKALRMKTHAHKKIKCRSFKDFTVDIYLDALKSCNFPNYENFQNIDEAYSDFLNKFMNIINTLAPLREIRVKSRTQEWFDGEIAAAIKVRNRNFKTFKKSRLVSDEQIYKDSKYFCRNLIRSKKTTFFQNKLRENIGKPKELWKTLKSLGLSKRNTAASICLKKEGTLSFDEKENSEIFKDFFSKLAENLLLKLPEPPKKFGPLETTEYYRKFNLTSNGFRFSKVSLEIVQDILENIEPSKAAGIDNLNGKFLRDAAKAIALPITQLCNLSIKYSSFPSACKIAKLKPIFKKGSKTDPKNYRPISLLPLISKVIEKVVHDQTKKYLDDHEIIFNYQSGFRENHSTDFVLSFLNDKILKGFDKGLYTGMVLIDLQKAFDTIDHEILLQKMFFLGFSKSVINWFKCYLSKRTFLVNINDKVSNPGSLTCGVPQGSILGPLLFLLYVNDMQQAVQSNLLLYADDSCIFYQDKNVEQLTK